MSVDDDVDRPEAVGTAEVPVNATDGDGNEIAVGRQVAAATEGGAGSMRTRICIFAALYVF